MRDRFAARRDQVIARFAAMEGVSLEPPGGAFYVFPDVSERIGAARNGVSDSVSLCDYLIEEARIVCVPGSAFGMEGHIRLSYAVSERDIVDGLDRLDAALHFM